MGDRKEKAKAAKKEAKASAKLQKKLGESPQSLKTTDSPSGPGRSAGDAQAQLTPAERSAAAAEKQVALQRGRVWIAVVTALIALAGVLVTLKPWRMLGSSTAPIERPVEGGSESKAP